MFMGFDGWHALIVLGMVLVPLAIVAVIVLVVVRVSRNQAASTPSAYPPQNPPAPAPSASDRLAELDRLREQGRISDAEYEQTRARILGEL